MRNTLLFLFCIQNLFSQTVLKGKIVNDTKNIEGAIIVNQSTKEKTVTNAQGEFEIKARVNDVLTIASPFIEGVEIQLNGNSFQKNPLLIRVKLKAKLLDEVIVRSITTKSLGIIGKNVKEYTPAERKLYTATGGGNLYGTNTIVSLDGILNLMSGRIAMLKKELIVEKYETNKKKLSEIFSNDFYTNTLQIPKENIEGFLVYAAENSIVSEALKAQNTNQLKFKLIELSIMYKEMIKTK